MADASMNYLYTIGAYAALFGLGYVIYHVSTQKNKKRIGATTNKNSQQESRKEDKKKKQRMESFVSDQGSGNKLSKTEARDQDKDKPTDANQWLSNAPVKDRQEGLDNREFARQLSKAKEGAKLSSKKNEGSKQREKSVKQSRANQIKNAAEDKPATPAVQAISSAPSSNGADADDDESPARSPEARPADVASVSDMLEPTLATGPSVLRLTDIGSQKQTKVAKAPEQAETKKQRQNRKKTEAAKAAREEAEKERKALEQNQRRLARIAEGRPAKDGSQFMAANGTKSAWTEGAPNGTNSVATENPDTAALYAPLDTLQKPAVTAAPALAPEQESAKKEANLKPEDSWMSSLPSEEEQMAMLRGESDDWNTVKNKSSKKAKKAASIDSGDEPSASRPSAQPKQPAANAKQLAKSTPTQSFGSFSALTVKDEPAEDVEEEWDV